MQDCSGQGHFVIYDAGCVHVGVMEVLRLWIEMGVVTLQDVRKQERFDGYYHNRFLVVNDCLHKYRFDAKWMFFFYLDEFIFLQSRTTLSLLLGELSGFTQFRGDDDEKQLVGRDLQSHLRSSLVLICRSDTSDGGAARTAFWQPLQSSLFGVRFPRDGEKADLLF